LVGDGLVVGDAPPRGPEAPPPEVVPSEGPPPVAVCVPPQAIRSTGAYVVWKTCRTGS
jgi:hypothetical protein